MNWFFVQFVSLLIIPSLNLINKYAGIAGIFLYILFVLQALPALCKYFLRHLIFKISQKEAFWLIVVTFCSLAAIFYICYPIANSGIFGPGSDRDEDINIATNALLHGRYPYYIKTYLGNNITHFPGSLFLSIPFVLLGNGAYQNFFWFLAFLIMLRFYLGGWRLALFLLWLLLILSPAILHEFVTGGDLAANSLYILIFTFFFVNALSKLHSKRWEKVLSAILLGVGFSSRLNFLLLLPLIFSTLVQNVGWRITIKYVALVGAVFVAITLPFYLYDSRNFTPLYGQFSKIGNFNSLFPFAAAFIIITGLSIAFLLSFQRMNSGCVVLFRNCAIVQAFLVLSPAILKTISQGKPEFSFFGFGFFFLFFGAASFWYSIIKRFK